MTVQNSYLFQQDPARKYVRKLPASADNTI